MNGATTSKAETRSAHADPQAKSAFRNLRHGATREQRAEVARTCLVLDEEHLDGMQLWCLASMEAFVEEIEKEPASGPFSDWRNARPIPSQFASVGQIRSAFGGWSAAKQKLLLTIPDPDFSWNGLGSKGHRFSREELTELLGDWLRTMRVVPTPHGTALSVPGTDGPVPGLALTPPPFASYKAHALNATVGEFMPPTNRQAFYRLFDDWDSALAAAILLGGGDDEVREFIALTLLSLSDKQKIALDFMREAKKKLGPRFTMDEFEANRSQRLVTTDDEALRRNLHVFTAKRIKHLFGGWFQAHYGLAPDDKDFKSFLPPRFWTDNEILETVRFYLVHAGTEGSGPGYQRWREQQPEPSAYPTFKTIRRRFGKWADVARAARGTR